MHINTSWDYVVSRGINPGRQRISRLTLTGSPRLGAIHSLDQYILQLISACSAIRGQIFCMETDDLKQTVPIQRASHVPVSTRER